MTPTEAALYLARIKAEFPAMSNERGRSLLDFLADLPARHGNEAFKRFVVTCDTPFGPTTKAIVEAFSAAAHAELARAPVTEQPWTQERKMAEFVAAIPLLLEWRERKRAAKAYVAKWIDEWLDGLVEKIKRGEHIAPPSMAHLVTGFAPF